MARRWTWSSGRPRGLWSGRYRRESSASSRPVGPTTNDALARHDPSRIANQRPGVELGAGGDYKPEPDVGVIDADYEAGQRFVERAYLLAEIASGTDEFLVPGTEEAWIEIKRRIYRDHGPCEAVLVIEQGRIEVRVDTRTQSGWVSETLADPQAELALPSFGLRCAVGDPYEGTPLQPRALRGG